MSKERDILKSLLLKEELELLDNLKQKVLSESQFTQEVSQVLTAAIKRAEKQDKNFERSLKGPIQRGVVKTFADNKQSIIDSIMPIMGQLIRKTVSNSIKQFVADINRTLELGFSAKALKWRWQAFKSGEKFADIVFQKTIHYQITEMFVISHENGLLIQHAGTDAEEVLKDKDALSAMLTGLQDFIGDSLQSSNSGLLSIEISDKEFLISTGPHAYLATVVKGSPTERLKNKLQQLIENIHSDYSDLIADQDQYQNDLEFSGYLQKHLITKSISDEKKSLNWKPWVFIILLVIIGLSYWAYQRNKEFKRVNQLTHSIPGLYVQDLKRDNGGYVVSGLMDPMADTSQLQTNNIELIVKPYVSLDQEIIQKRVDKAVDDYKAITATLKGNVVTLSGQANENDSLTLTNKLYTLSGVDKVINQLIMDKTEEINTNEDNNLIKKKELTESINAMKKSIHDSSINLTKYQANNVDEKQKLNEIIENIQFILKNKNQTQISIIGESDCYGKKSDAYSHQRALFIKDIFVKNNINEKSIVIKIKPCVILTSKENLDNKNVKFRLQ